MANQLTTLCDPKGHYPGEYHSKLYEDTSSKVSDKIQAALLAKAKQDMTADNEQAVRKVAWEEVVYEAKELLQTNPEQRERVEEEVTRCIVISLHMESQQTIDEWKAAWMDGLKAAILEEPMTEKVTQMPTTPLLQDNKVEARVAIAVRLQQVKQEFLTDLKHQIALLEQDTAQHEQRLAKAKAKAEADIALELEPWKNAKTKHLRDLLMVKTFNEILNEDVALLRAAANRLGFDMVKQDNLSSNPRKRHIFPDTRAKCSQSGSRARRTPSPTRDSGEDMEITPTKHSQPTQGRQLTIPPLTTLAAAKTGNIHETPKQREAVATLQPTTEQVTKQKEDAGQTVSTSMHNLANQMTDDDKMQARARGEPTLPVKPNPDPTLMAVLEGIQKLSMNVLSITEWLDNLKQQAKEKHQAQSTDPRPYPP
ncbi:hypothetical protein EI94DRAFT_1805253 [Lactarius quietus]|nr:hypothetical protein EI94DRAFT_1805253 [Lactarius quietus]